MRKAPSLLSFSTDSCSTLGWGTVRSLMFKAPWEERKRNRASSGHWITRETIENKLNLFFAHFEVTLLLLFTNLFPRAESPYLVSQIINTVQSRVDHQHGVGQRLVLELRHGKHSVVQLGTGAHPERFLHDAHTNTQNWINTSLMLWTTTWSWDWITPVWAEPGCRAGRVWDRPGPEAQAAGWSTQTVGMTSVSQRQRWSSRLSHHSDWPSHSGPQLERERERVFSEEEL